MTSVRHFTSASSESITLSLGSLGFAFGPGTVIALVNFATLGAANETVFSAGAANAQSYMLQVLAPTPNVALRLDGNERHSTTTSLSTSTWYLIGATKATGTATPRIHIYACTGATWAHENASSSIANSSTPATRAQLGVTPAGAAYMNGNVQLAAVWDSVLDDTAMETLVSLTAIIDASPVGLWILDQASTATAVTDYTGNGADQSAISGTSVTTDTIPNFDMSYPATSQTLYPDADVDTGDWVTTPLWSKVDEVTAGGDVISSTAS